MGLCVYYVLILCGSYALTVRVNESAGVDLFVTISVSVCVSIMWAQEVNSVAAE